MSSGAACSDGGGSDASVDIDNGACGSMLRFTGEYVDWDTHKAFCGINNATLTLAGGGSMSSTSPNGRFDMCIPSTGEFQRIDITQPSAMSACSVPSSTYAIPTILVARKDVITHGAMFSGRAFTTKRENTFFPEILQPYDPTRAQVFVHVVGTPRKVSLLVGHGPAQIVSGTGWVEGDTGAEVFFPNVLAQGTAMITISSGIGGGLIPVVPGSITNVTLIGN